MFQGWLRRRLQWYLKRSYVKKWQKRRSGECKRCGICCFGCLAFDKKEIRCRIYTHRPTLCRLYPLAPEDKKDNPDCGFCFED
ncbi:MAG: YkgJ family cysteine cluster protein [Candidatus Altiarchaeota archaeon]